jgi:hypothetical protein
VRFAGSFYHLQNSHTTVGSVGCCRALARAPQPSSSIASMLAPGKHQRVQCSVWEASTLQRQSLEFAVLFS